MKESEFTQEQKQRILDISEKQITQESSWFQNILIMTSGLLGLLITLHKDPSCNACLHLLYVLCLSMLGLGILTGAVFLFAQSNTSDRLRKKYYKELSESPDAKSVKDVKVYPYKFFEYCRWATFVILFLSLPVLIYYAVLLDSI